MFNAAFYRNKKVLVTGSTGFKGSWLCFLLNMLGADVTGYALGPQGEHNLFEIAKIDKKIDQVIGDIRDLSHLKKVFNEKKPEVVLHLAAQPIVRESYREPVYTYETNIMGTVNVLECIRTSDTVGSFLNITTDKVYENKEWEWGYREIDTLDGYDVYSNSKSCSELVTSSYRKSFLTERNLGVSTARAGNVIGGGDFSVDRIIPDCVRAARNKEVIAVRNQYSVRPYQHVLDPLFAYLLIVEKQFQNKEYSQAYNIGPDETGCVSTGQLVSLFTKEWGDGLTWSSRPEAGPHEANFLKLDCSKMKSVFGWRPQLRIEEAVQMVVEWTKIWNREDSVMDCMEQQINLVMSKLV